MGTTKGISLKRVLEVFFANTLLDFYINPPKDLRNGPSWQVLDDSSLDCEKIFDLVINKEHDLRGRKERQKALKYTTLLQKILDELDDFEVEVQRKGLSSEIKGEIFNIYLRRFIRKLYIIHENL